MPKILIPTPLRPFADNQARLDVDGRTVGEAMKALVAKYPRLEGHLYDDGGALRNFVNVYVGEDDIRYRERTETPVEPDSEISIVPSVAGGADGPAGGIAPGVVAAAPEEVGLSNEEIRRYSRHLIMPEVTLEGQRRLKASSVLLVGAGGLGSPLA
ncbi:MAG: MoaD/ThiS family protein, partial [Gemmatimonadota bacterium]